MFKKIYFCLNKYFSDTQYDGANTFCASYLIIEV